MISSQICKYFALVPLSGCADWYPRYNDDDPKPAAAAATAAPEPAAHVPVVEPPKPEPVASGEDVSHGGEQNGGGDRHMIYGDEGDDDEVDFNLGGSGNNFGVDGTGYGGQAPIPTAKGPNSKEDG